MSNLQEKRRPETAVFLDTSIPNVARIFDYLAGGTANFEVDRIAAESMLQLIPSLGKWIRLRRAFIQEATFQLYEAGFRQFFDAGSGMPADDHIHAFAPEANIVLSDINPVAVSYGQSIFSDKPNVSYIRGDVRQIEALFITPDVRRLIDPSKPIAIGLNGVMLFLTETENKQMLQSFYDWAPAGSKIFLVLQTRADGKAPESYEKFRQMCRSAGLPIEVFPYSQVLGMLAPWQVEQVTPIADFLGLPEDFISDEDKTNIGLEFYAAFLNK